MRPSFFVFASLGLSVLMACRPSSEPAGHRPANYELRCASSDTATASQLYCVRTDTRTGDILRVNYLELPVSSGATAVAAGPAARFATTCDATSTDTRSDFYCVRLDTNTGEMLLIDLRKVGALPAPAR